MTNKLFVMLGFHLPVWGASSAKARIVAADLRGFGTVQTIRPARRHGHEVRL